MKEFAARSAQALEDIASALQEISKILTAMEYRDRARAAKDAKGRGYL